MLKKIFLLLSMSASYSVFALQGYGKNDGGNNYPLYHVTTLADSGTGSLRDALSQSGRRVVFDVNGTIKLLKPITLSNINNLTIDGTYNKAQHVNLAISGYGIYLANSHDIILQNFRIRDAAKYGLLISDNCYNIVADHMSIINSSQNDVEFGKNIDINNSAHDITVSYSIIAYESSNQDVLDTKYKGLLITDNAMAPVSNVALHHNLFYQNYQRSPEISSPGQFVMVNNIIYDWRSYGTRLRNGSQGDLIENYYETRLLNKQKDALVITNDAKQYFLQDNWGVNLNLIPADKQASNIVGKLPTITTSPATILLSTLPAQIGALPHDIQDNTILTGLKR